MTAAENGDDSTTDVILMGARLYDPNLGRFYSIDPIDGGSLNGDDYAGQDPINGYDLDGTKVGGPGASGLAYPGCGKRGKRSCAGVEGKANDPLFSNRAVIANGIAFGLTGGPGGDALLGALRIVSPRAIEAIGPSRALIAARAVIGAERGERAIGVGAADASPKAAWVARAVGAIREVFRGRLTVPELSQIRRSLKANYWAGF